MRAYRILVLFVHYILITPLAYKLFLKILYIGSFEQSKIGFLAKAAILPIMIMPILFLKDVKKNEKNQYDKYII